MFFAPNQLPRAIFTGEFPADFIRAVVRKQTRLQIIGLADVKATLWILENIDPEHGTDCICALKKWLQR